MDKLTDLGPTFTRKMALCAGLTDRDLRNMLRDGTIRSLTRGLYAQAGVELDVTGRAMAYGLVLPPHHVICDRTAASVWGVDTDEYPGEKRFRSLDLVAIDEKSRTRRDGCSGGVRNHLTKDDIVLIGTVPVTVPVRTALDLACKLKPMGALASVETFLRMKLATREELLAQLPRFRGRRGIRLCREVVEIAHPKVESTGESFTKMVIHRAGLPAPRPQVEVLKEDGSKFRLDLAYEGLKVAIEYDGAEFHGPEQRAADKARRKWLCDHGWYVIVVRKDQLAGHAAQKWIDELRAVLMERARKADRYSRFQWA